MPNSDFVNFYGLNLMKSYSFIAVMIKACDPNEPPVGDTCASEREIEEYISRKVLEIWVKTNFVDYDDIDKPVHSYL